MTTGRINQVTTVFLRRGRATGRPGPGPSRDAPPPRPSLPRPADGQQRRPTGERERDPGSSQTQRHTRQALQTLDRYAMPSDATDSAAGTPRPALAAGVDRRKSGATGTRTKRKTATHTRNDATPLTESMPDLGPADAIAPHGATHQGRRAGKAPWRYGDGRCKVDSQGSPTAPRLNKRHGRVSSGAVKHTAAAATAAPHSSLTSTT